MSNRCNGQEDYGPVQLLDSKAYCEGRAYAVGGGLKADNPHEAGSFAAEAWDLGHDSYAAGVGSPLPRDCCADVAYDGVP